VTPLAGTSRGRRQTVDLNQLLILDEVGCLADFATQPDDEVGSNVRVTRESREGAR
jgi:hypothetical protein